MAIWNSNSKRREQASSTPPKRSRANNDASSTATVPMIRSTPLSSTRARPPAYDYWSFGTSTPTSSSSDNNNNNSNSSIIRFLEGEDSDDPYASPRSQWSNTSSDDDDEQDEEKQGKSLQQSIMKRNSPPNERSALILQQSSGGGDYSTTSLTISTSNDDSYCCCEDSSLDLHEALEEGGGGESGGGDSEYNYSYSSSSSSKASSERQKKRQEAVDTIRNQMEFTLPQCIAAFLVYMGIAVVAFSFVLDTQWSVIDSCYFALVTSTTIGYGDLVPQTLTGRIFTCFFAVTGVAFLGIALGVLGSRLIEAQEKAMQQASEMSKRRAMSLFHRSSSSSNFVKEEEEEEEAVAVQHEEKQKQGLQRIFLELAAVGVLLVLFASVIMQDPGVDANLAASRWSQWGNAIYYVLITATTVGYGDFYPSTQTGRLMAIFFIVLSVGAMGHWLSLVAGYIMENRQSVLQKQIQAKELTMQDLEVMDEDGDGQVTQIEFIEFMLMAMNKVDAETLAGLKQYFHRLDRDGNGTLSKDDLVDTVKGKLPTYSSLTRRNIELSSATTNYQGDFLTQTRLTV